MATNFAVPVNNASTTVSVAKTTTTLPYTLTVTNGAVFSTALTGSQYYRVTICQVAFAYSPTATTANYTIYKADTVSGNTIVLESVLEGTTDKTFAVGDIVEVRVTAGTLSDIQNAILQIGNTVPSGTNNSVLYVDGSGNLADSGPVYTASTQSLLVGNGATGSTPQIGLNYKGDGTSGGNIVYSADGTSMFAFGGNNDGTFGGTLGTVSGRNFYIYDYNIPNYRFGVNASGTFYFGPSTTNHSLVVNQPNTGVTGTTVNADGTLTLPAMANTSANNSSLFIDSSASNKLCWKDGSGNLHYST